MDKYSKLAEYVAEIINSADDDSLAGVEIPEEWARESCERYRKMFERNDDRSAILKAINVCSEAGVSPPRWAAIAFNLLLEMYRSHQFGTLDEAFGCKKPKGKHLKKLCEERLYGPKVAQRVKDLHAQKRNPYRRRIV